LKKLLLLFIILSGTRNYFAQEAITTEEISNSIGKDVIVVGQATQVKIMESKMVYINIDGEFPDNKLTGVVFKKDADKFENVKDYEGKKVELTGKLELYKGKPQIVLKKKEQLKIIE
jgi:exonuclease VII large subunit